eukprot:355237-Chlamydomonas_euryale.AAC.12
MRATLPARRSRVRLRCRAGRITIEMAALLEASAVVSTQLAVAGTRSFMSEREKERRFARVARPGKA